MDLHPTPTDLAVGLRVVVRCREGYSQRNHGRAGRVVRPTPVYPGYEIKFDVPDEAGHDWDFHVGEELMVTATQSGKKLDKQMDIPSFLLVKNRKVDGAEKVVVRRAEAAATRAVEVAHGRGTVEEQARRRHPDTPGGRAAAEAEVLTGNRMPREIEPQQLELIKTETADRAAKKKTAQADRSEERSAMRAAEKTRTWTVKRVAEELTGERPGQSRVRKRDVKKWCQEALVPLPKKFDQEHADKVKACVRAKLGAGPPAPAGRGAKPGGTSAAPAPAAQPEASQGGPGKAPAAPAGAPAGKAPKLARRKAPGRGKARKGGGRR